MLFLLRTPRSVLEGHTTFIQISFAKSTGNNLAKSTLTLLIKRVQTLFADGFAVSAGKFNIKKVPCLNRA